ncbi:MAG TPA: holo-ACP synthase [Methanocorpusculum sp.]|nr:holo-ACP synthase [Methanocorpusculum sp.]
MKIFTGCDIVRISRFSDLLSDTHFLDRCFTRAEQEYCFAKANPAQHFAARFAGKEAVLKALSGIDVRYFIGNLEIVVAESGRPSMVFHGNAVSQEQLPPDLTADISLSHDGEYAMATAVVYIP